MNSKNSKNQASKQEYGTMTAKFDANNDYSTNNATSQASGNKQKASKADYGTLTAKEDANNDYK